MVKANRWVMAERFAGFPKYSDIQLVEEVLPDLRDGQCLVEAVYFSVDPYMRPYMDRLPVGSTMLGEQLGKVVATKWAEYPIGTLVLVNCGWRSHSILTKNHRIHTFRKIPDAILRAGLPPSVSLGVLGLPGCTAYFGLLRICNPQPGEVVLVNGGAGAVGSAVGQIAKIKGCKVIGYAGSDAKCEYMKKLGFDHVFNYKTVDIETSLREAAPEGVDCFFDNVGGKFLDTVLRRHFMNPRGRMSLCGAISQYNKGRGELDEIKLPNFMMVSDQLRMEGFIATQWLDEWPAAIQEMAQWCKEGKLRYDEHITEGFNNLPKAFFGMLRGENTGKAVVKCNL